VFNFDSGSGHSAKMPCHRSNTLKCSTLVGSHPLHRIIPHLVIHSFSSRVQIPPAPGATRSPASLLAPPAPRLPSPTGTAPSPPSTPVVTPPFPLLVSSHLPSPASQRAASHDERFRGRRWAGLPRARARADDVRSSQGNDGRRRENIRLTIEKTSRTAARGPPGAWPAARGCRDDDNMWWLQPCFYCFKKCLSSVLSSTRRKDLSNVLWMTLGVCGVAEYSYAECPHALGVFPVSYSDTFILKCYVVGPPIPGLRS
jgi:hypothetical protein